MRLAALLALLPCLLTAQTKVLIIGDSMSAEYQYQTPFSAPESDPLNANTMSWSEILIDRRGADFDFGNKSDLQWDTRGPGYEYNWAVPGADTEFWEEFFEADPIWDPILYLSRGELLDQLDEVHVAVVVIGANDVNKQYGDLYDNLPEPDFPDGTIERITLILDALRDERSDLPIVLVNIPDIGATPDIQEDHPDPAGRADASALIAGLNVLMADLAASFDARLVDLSSITAEVIAPEPFFIGPQRMVKSYDDENPPDHLFCRMKFHPASGLHALLANRIIAGINAELGTTVAPLPNREIIAEVLGLNPDQAFLDWIATHPGATPDPGADDDGDSLDALGEMALGTDPLVPDDLPNLEPDGSGWVLPFSPDPAAARYVRTIAEESADLTTWNPVPSERLLPQPDGSIHALLPAGASGYGRLRFVLQP